MQAIFCKPRFHHRLAMVIPSAPFGNKPKNGLFREPGTLQKLPGYHFWNIESPNNVRPSLVSSSNPFPIHPSQQQASRTWLNDSTWQCHMSQSWRTQTSHTKRLLQKCRKNCGNKVCAFGCFFRKSCTLTFCGWKMPPSLQFPGWWIKISSRLKMMMIPHDHMDHEPKFFWGKLFKQKYHLRFLTFFWKKKQIIVRFPTLSKQRVMNRQIPRNNEYIIHSLKLT